MCCVNLQARIVGKHGRHVTEFAYMRSARPHFAFLVDDCPIVLLGCCIKSKHRPAIFHRKYGRKRVIDHASPRLGLERVDVHLRMSVEKTVRGVPTVLIHRADHQQLETTAHSNPPLNHVLKTHRKAASPGLYIESKRREILWSWQPEPSRLQKSDFPTA